MIQKALELEKKRNCLPTLAESKAQGIPRWPPAARSANDQFIRTFLERRPDGVIVQLGYGLRRLISAAITGTPAGMLLDMPHVVEYRRALLSSERETYLAGMPLPRTGSGRSAPMSGCSYSGHRRRPVPLF